MDYRRTTAPRFQTHRHDATAQSLRNAATGSIQAALIDPWPGNVRELRNVIERAMLLATRDPIEPQDLTRLARSAASTPFALPAEGVKLEDVERQLLVQAFERSGGNQSRAAELLSLHRDQVRYRIEKFGLQLA